MQVVQSPHLSDEGHDVTAYKRSLDSVLEWLVEAENTLQHQEDISDNVQDVRMQFQNHEVR